MVKASRLSLIWKFKIRRPRFLIGREHFQMFGFDRQSSIADKLCLKIFEKGKDNLQICANIASLGCMTFVRLVVGRVAPEHIRRAVDCRTRCKARLNADFILCVGWVIDFERSHIQRMTAGAALVPKASSILYLRISA